MLWRVLVVIVVFLALLATATTAAPVRIRAMDDGEMAPAIGHGDAYIVVDAGTVDVGDIVVVWSPETGTFETRRVVGETDQGYLTRGDAAERTDQTAGGSPIPRSGIVGEVASLGGRPVVIPWLGGPVGGLGDNPLIGIGLAALVGAGLLVRERRAARDPDPHRAVWRVSDVAEGAFLVLLVLSVALTPLGVASFQLTFLIGADSGESRYAVPVGESMTRTIELPVTRTPATQLVVEGDGLTVERWDRTDDGLAVTVTVPPTEATGPRSTAVTVYPYPAVLPNGVIGPLHGIHPAVAVLASALALLVIPVGLYLLFIDGSRPLRISRERRSGRERR